MGDACRGSDEPEWSVGCLKIEAEQDSSNVRSQRERAYVSKIEALKEHAACLAQTLESERQYHVTTKQQYLRKGKGFDKGGCVCGQAE